MLSLDITNELPVTLIASQVGEIIIKLEKILLESKPDAVIVPGDTNSALASAIITAKLRMPLIHIEAGARWYDMSMQEKGRFICL